MAASYLLIDEITYEASARETSDYWKWKCRSRRSDADASYEDHCLEALAENSDERQDEHGIFLTPFLEASAERSGFLGAVFGFKGLSELDPPLVLKLGDSKESGTHDGDDDGCEKSERTLPEVFACSPMIFTDGVKSTNEAGPDADANEQANGGTEPYLKFC